MNRIICPKWVIYVALDVFTTKHITEFLQNKFSNTFCFLGRTEEID